MSYVDEVLTRLKEKNASEPEFLQAAEEVLESLRPVIDANEAVQGRTAVTSVGKYRHYQVSRIRADFQKLTDRSSDRRRQGRI